MRTREERPIPCLPRTPRRSSTSCSVGVRPMARPSRTDMIAFARSPTRATEMYGRASSASPEASRGKVSRNGGFHSQSIWGPCPDCLVSSWASPTGGMMDSAETVQLDVSVSSSPPSSSAQITGLRVPPSIEDSARANGVAALRRPALTSMCRVPWSGRLGTENRLAGMDPTTPTSEAASPS